MSGLDSNNHSLLKNHTTNITSDVVSPSVTTTEPLASLVIRMILTCIVGVLALIGNVLVVLVVRKNRQLRSVKNHHYGLFLLNLSIADLALIVIVIPFNIVYFETGKYSFGLYGSTVACKILPFIALTSQGASIYSLTSLTLQRYRAIVHPMLPRLTLTKVKLLIAMVWIFAMSFAFPEIIVFEVISPEGVNRFSCRENWPNVSLQKGYTIFLFLQHYLIPLLLIVAAYISMAITLKKREYFLRRNSISDPHGNIGDRSQHQKIIRLLLVLMAVFAVCYLPLHLLFMWFDFGDGADFIYFTVLLKYSHLLIWTNSMINPFLYGALDDYYKQGYLKIVRKCTGFAKSGKEVRTNSVRSETPPKHTDVPISNRSGSFVAAARNFSPWV